jgi:hypothetical protein
MLKTILFVSGRPGLFKLISQGKNMLFAESLANKLQIPVYAKDKVLSLADIAIYAEGREVPLHEVFTNIRNKENGEKASIDLATAQPDDLRAYLAEFLPDFDRGKVYPSDIRKMISWYNLLISSGITQFTPEAKPEEKTPEEETPEENKD